MSLWQDPFEEIKKVTKGKVQPSLTSSFEERCQPESRANESETGDLTSDCIQ